MNNYMISLIRTYTPVAVGAVVAWLAVRGFHLDTQAQAGITALLTGVITAAYYAGVRALEAKYPWLGMLLGHTAKPNYSPSGVTPVSAGPPITGVAPPPH